MVLKRREAEKVVIGFYALWVADDRNKLQCNQGETLLAPSYFFSQTISTIFFHFNSTPKSNYDPICQIEGIHGN